MRTQSIIKLITLILFLFQYNIQYSQIIPNMSFEGTPQQDIPPNGWSPCNEFSTPDTQPGFWEVTKTASNGNTYISVVTRGNLGPYANHIEVPLLTDATTIQKFEPFKNEILQLPTVTGVTYASSFPGSEIGWHRTDITLGEENADYRYNSRIISIGTEFLDVFGLSLVSGRNFNPDIEGDDKAMLINEEACKMFGFKTFDEALNKFIFIGSRKFEVIGVLENYHYRSFQYQMQPILYIQGYPRNPTYAVKIGSENISGTISTIETKWKEAYTGNVFRYYFLDDKFSRQYSSEEQTGIIVTGLAFLAIIISCLGLFGLSLYSVNRRTKEIGIRKVLGASIFNVVILLSSDFFRLVLIGGVIGIPFAYQGVNLWLERYAYQMPIDISLFVLPVVIVTLLTLVTISFQTMTAAKTNPVDSIKYE